MRVLRWLIWIPALLFVGIVAADVIAAFVDAYGDDPRYFGQPSPWPLVPISLLMCAGALALTVYAWRAMRPRRPRS